MLDLVKNTLFVALTICLWFTSYCFTQDRMEKLLTKEGQLISEGSNTTPVGALKVTTYRLEIISPTSASSEVENNDTRTKLFRLTIRTQEGLPMETFSVWIDGEESYGAVQVGRKSVVLLRYAKSLRNGLSLGLSIRGKKDLANRSVLPEPVYVSSPYATPADELETATPIIKLKRLPRTIELMVEYSRGGCFDAMTNLPRYSTIEIEGFEIPRRIMFMCGGDGNDFVGHFSPEEFARIPNGANIIKVVVNGNNVSREVVGRLDKGTMQ